MTYAIFTANLRNMREMRRELKKIEDELEVILYDMTGVKGIRYDNTPVSFNPSLSALKQLEGIERYDELLRERNYLQTAIAQTEECMEGMPTRLKSMLIDLYVHGLTYKKAGEKYGYSDYGLWSYVKRETEKHL